MRFPRLSWFTSLPAAMFYCLATSAAHESIGGPNGAPAAASLLASCLLGATMAFWILRDMRQRDRAVPYDFDSMVFLTWPVFVPIYLLSTRGWRGLAPIGILILIYLAAAIFPCSLWLLASLL